MKCARAASTSRDRRQGPLSSSRKGPGRGGGRRCTGIAGSEDSRGVLYLIRGVGANARVVALQKRYEDSQRSVFPNVSADDALHWSTKMRCSVLTTEAEADEGFRKMNSWHEGGHQKQSRATYGAAAVGVTRLGAPAVGLLDTTTRLVGVRRAQDSRRLTWLRRGPTGTRAKSWFPARTS
eukprot:1984332-Rhodomonas_salina.1